MVELVDCSSIGHYLCEYGKGHTAQQDIQRFIDNGRNTVVKPANLQKAFAMISWLPKAYGLKGKSHNHILAVSRDI